MYDERTNQLSYTNAGHLAPMLLRDGVVEMLESTGTVVGAFPVARYGEKTVRLGPGDVLVAYTDGIVEPENAYGEMYGEERLKDLLLKYSKADCAEIIARIDGSRGPVDRRRRASGRYDDGRGAPLMKVLTAAEMREVDRRTVEAGIPGIVLMENAAHRVVELLAREVRAAFRTAHRGAVRQRATTAAMAWPSRGSFTRG